VINPNLDTISPRRLATEFGAEILITNSYIIHGDDDLRERALEEGLHDLLDFPGAIMTDSGSFQLSEYGEIDVTTEEILAFQREIGSDIATPVDIPTPPDVSHERAEADLETTQERLEIAEAADTGEMLVSAPVQGSTYPDLRERAGRHADGTDLDVFPVGAVVPLLNDYRYDDMIDVVVAAKRGLGADAPVHLFGAGHPMMFALAVAMGCDLFDSAAYALYARDDRYLTVRGTRQLADLEYLPCSCAICTEYSPDELRALPDDERESELGSAQPPRHLRRNPADQGGDPRRQPARTRRAARPRPPDDARRLPHAARPRRPTRALGSRLEGLIFLHLPRERAPPRSRPPPRAPRAAVRPRLPAAHGGFPAKRRVRRFLARRGAVRAVPRALSRSYPSPRKSPSGPIGRRSRPRPTASLGSSR